MRRASRDDPRHGVGRLLVRQVGAFARAETCYTDCMTVLERFMSFAQGLPADRLHSVETALATLMASYSDKHEFTATELAELDRRLSEANPRFSNRDDITKLFGKPFSA